MQHPTRGPVTLVQNVRPWGGAPSDMVLIDAANPSGALVRTPPRALVIGGGRVLHAA